MVYYKKLIIVIGILLFAFKSFAQVEVPKCGADKINIEEQRNKIKNNNIRQKIKLENMIRGDAMTMEKERTEVISYDNLGRTTEWAYYKNNKQVKAIYRYSYDPRGNISELTLFSDIGEVLEKTVYGYDNSGYLSQETFFEAGNTFVSRTDFETDVDARTVTETEHDVNNSPVAKTIYYYSDLDKGDLTKKEVYKQGNMYYSVEFIYSTSGEIEREDFFSAPRELAYQFMYKHNEKGNSTEKIKYSPDRVVLQRFTNYYTKSGLEKGITEYDRQGRNISSIQYEYKNF